MQNTLGLISPGPLPGILTSTGLLVPQTEHLAYIFNPIMVEGYAALFSCTAVVQASDSMTASM